MPITLSAGESEEDYKTPRGGDPCKNLVAALIERSVMDLKQPDYVVRRDAQKWLFSESKARFSFLWSMEVLELECGVRKLRTKAKELIKEVTQKYDVDKQSRKGCWRGKGVFEFS